MKDFNSLSGPWLGFSVQDGIRISEKLLLQISGGSVRGTGKDKDGEFELTGYFQSRNQGLMLTRRYTRTTEPSQEGVGVPYDYEGKWDGSIAFGRWHPRHYPPYGGEFEMWPDIEEDRLSNLTEIRQEEPLALPGRT